ncbi:histidinol-phosphate transaminase [Psychrobacter pygoscelis]|uniref:histidinol-phosphate transaminase n=1 Tax=Psychrobacter pygoscelis TaxID=2488563 RepID=UPI00103C2A82|nr:histidinol-phosphate transaminase [Psychrobacter pygoscelis]
MSEYKIDTRLWSTKARNLMPYTPGEQPRHDNLCKLNTNENPFPPSVKVAEAIAAELAEQATGLRLYPMPESNNLKQSLAETYQVQPEQVFVGNGSDEVLALVFACFFLKERPLLAPDISYSFYPVYAETFGIEMVQIPLSEDFSIDTDDYRRPCSGVIIANPNAPTGLLLSLDAVSKLASEHPNAVIVIDEAYIDFARADNGAQVSAVSLINDFDNLLVTQTFSKSRSLAGLRVGMAFGNVSLIAALTRMKNSFNSYPLDKLAQAGATACLQDTEYFEQVCAKIIELREAMTKGLVGLGFEVLPSHANFVFARPKDGNAAEIAANLREKGIIVRHFNAPRINEYLRITVGTEAQTQRLISALQEMQE